MVSFDEVYAAANSPDAIAKLAAFVATRGDINSVDPTSGWSLLHCACEHQNYELIRALADLDADVNIQCEHDGWSPFHLAVDIDIDSVWQSVQTDEFADHLTFKTTRLIHSIGGDPKLLTLDGLTPRQLAASFGDGALKRFDQLVGK